MTNRITFADLAGLRDSGKALTPDDDRWLANIARRVDATAHTVAIGRSRAATDPEPVLQRQLDGSWRAGRYVGELRQGDRILDIVPRLGIKTIASWASAALNLRVVPQTGKHAGTQTLIAELAGAIWSQALLEASRHGPPGLRAAQRHSGVNARGRLDIERTIALRSARTPLLGYVERAKLTDNPVSRAIVLADRVLNRQLGHRPEWRGDRVAELLPRLQAATGPRPLLPTRRELNRVRYTPITLPYRRVAELSWEIAHQRGARTSAAGDTVEGLLIDVAELWELFLVHCTRRATTARVTHGTIAEQATPLLRSAATPDRTLGRLYPDILVGDPGASTFVIDAKYKPLTDPRGVDREDLYQLTSYLLARNSDGMLAYPNLDQQTDAYAERHGPWRTPEGHNVRFMTFPITEAQCVAAITYVLNA